MFVRVRPLNLRERAITHPRKISNIVNVEDETVSKPLTLETKPSLKQELTVSDPDLLYDYAGRS